MEPRLDAKTVDELIYKLFTGTACTGCLPLGRRPWTLSKDGEPRGTASLYIVASAISAGVANVVDGAVVLTEAGEQRVKTRRVLALLGK